MEVNIIFESILLFVGGIISGAYGSVTGSAALVNIPLLILTGLPVPVAIGTNHLTAIPWGISSILAYRKKGFSHWKIPLLVGLVGIPMSILGVNILLQIDEKIVSYLAAIGLLALLPILPRINVKKISLENSKFQIKHLLPFLVLTSLLSIYAGFYGVGFGTFIMFAFIILRKESILEGAASARIVTLLVIGSAAITFVINGKVSYQSFIPLALGSTIGAYSGVHFATKVNDIWIKILLVAVIILSVIKLVVDA